MNPNFKQILRNTKNRKSWLVNEISIDSLMPLRSPNELLGAQMLLTHLEIARSCPK